MAGRGGQSWEKRQREKDKREKQLAKQARREERKAASDEDEGDDDDGPSEAELYERFARLSERHAAGQIDDETFAVKREELFELLGLESH